MTRLSKHLLAASALLGAVALAAPALAQRSGMTERTWMDASGKMGGRMHHDIALRCGLMMQGMPGGTQGGRPNQQWRHPNPAPDRD